MKLQGFILRRELLAGATTFITLAYILIIEPQMLAQSGMDPRASFWVVAMVTGMASILCGLLSNLPFALGPGLGLLSFFSYVVVGKLGFSYPAALAAVLVSGLLFVLITLTKVRQWLLEAIPPSLGCAIAAGIGFFIALIALNTIHLIEPSSVTLVQLGKVNTPEMALFFFGFLVIAILDRHEIPGAILCGMLLTTVLGWVLHVSPFYGVFSGAFGGMNYHVFNFDFHPLLQSQTWPLIFTFLMVALFDSTGTMLGLSRQMGQGTLPVKKLNRALLAESLATSFSACFGGTTTAAFLESSAGIKAGGRTGIVAVTVGVFFLLTVFLYPLAKSIPTYATASGLFYVSCLMIRPFADVNWQETEEFIPAVMTLLMIPLTFSIVDGVGLGLICYVILKVAARKYRELPPMLWALMVLFLGYFLWMV